MIIMGRGALVTTLAAPRQARIIALNVLRLSWQLTMGSQAMLTGLQILMSRRSTGLIDTCC
jgi:hypothetical protein